MSHLSPDQGSLENHPTQAEQSHPPPAAQQLADPSPQEAQSHLMGSQIFEFPNEAEGVKRPLRKPPARFAKRMEEKNKKKQQQPTPPVVTNFDDQPIGGKPKSPIDTPQQRPDSKKTKPQSNRQRKAPEQARNHKEVEISIERAIDPKQGFDDTPIGKGSSNFAVSQFAEGAEETPMEVNYTMEQKLKSKAVKLRLLGLEELLCLLQEDENNPQLAEVDMAKLTKESNPACLQKSLQCLKVWVARNRNWGDEECKNVIENGYVNGKGNCKKVAVEIIDQMYEEVCDIVEMAITIGLKGKVPKILTGYISILNELLAIYGAQRLKFMKPYLADLVVILNREKLVAVKTEGMSLLKQCCKWLTKEVIDPLIKDLKEGLRKELEAFWAEYDKTQVMSAPKDVQDEVVGKPKKKMDAYELSEAVDIFKKYGEKWSEKVLKEEKWNEKVKLMQQFISDASVPKISHNSEYRHISEMIRRLINHSNMSVVIHDLKILAVLSKGLRRHFYPTAKNMFPAVIAKFRDKKTQMVEETFSTLNDLTFSVNLEEVIDDVTEGLCDKAPNMKVNLLNWIAKHVEKKTEETGQLSQKSMEALQGLIPVFERLMGDGVAEVRDATVKNIGKLKLVLGEDFFTVMDKKTSKGQGSKAEETKKSLPKKASREKKEKAEPEQANIRSPAKSAKSEIKPAASRAGSLNEQIQELLPRMSHHDWEKRKQCAEAMMQVFEANEGKKVQLQCLNDLLSALKTRISDPNKNIIKYFVQLTVMVFEVMSEKQVKTNAKAFTCSLADGLSDKVPANRIQISAALNKIGSVYGTEQLLTYLGPYLDNDRDSRIEILNIILENEEFIAKADTKEYPKGIIRGLTDRNKQIRHLSEQLFQKVYPKTGMKVFNNLARNQRPAILKDLNLFFSKYDSRTKTTTNSIVSPAKRPPTAVSSRGNSALQSQRSLSKISRCGSNEDIEWDSRPVHYQNIPTRRGSEESVSIKLQSRKNLVEGDSVFAPMSILSAERTRRNQVNEKEPWICDMIPEPQEDALIESIESLFKASLSKKMLSHDHGRVMEAASQLIGICRDSNLHNEIKEVYDLIFRWIFLRLWGGNPALQSLIEILPPLMAVLEKKEVLVTQDEAEIIIAIQREHFVMGSMNDFKVSDRIYPITRSLVALTSGDKVLKKFLLQFNYKLHDLHRHVKPSATTFYREGLRNLIKSELMDHIGMGILEEIANVAELKSDAQFTNLLSERVNPNVLIKYGFTPPAQQAVAANTLPETPEIVVQDNGVRANKCSPRESTLSAGKSTTLNIDSYRLPPMMSPLSKQLKRLLPPNEETIGFFMTLLDNKNEALRTELTAYAPAIFGHILRSVLTMMNSRSKYLPEKIFVQIALLQQAVRNKILLANLGDLLVQATHFIVLQLVYENENKADTNRDLQARGLDNKAEQFIKAINGVLLRLIEKASSQDMLNILLFLLNHHATLEPISQKTVSLVINCLTRVSERPLAQVTDQGTLEFLIGLTEYLDIIGFDYKLEEFEPLADQRLKPEESVIRALKNVLNSVIRHYGSQLWVIIDCHTQFLGHPDQCLESYLHHHKIKRLSEEDYKRIAIASKLRSSEQFEQGINLLKQLMDSSADFNLGESLKSMGLEAQIVQKVTDLLEKHPTIVVSPRAAIRSSRSPLSRRSPPAQQYNFKEQLLRLKNKEAGGETPKAESGSIQVQDGASRNASGRKLEINRRIEEMRRNVGRTR